MMMMLMMFLLLLLSTLCNDIAIAVFGEWCEWEGSFCSRSCGSGQALLFRRCNCPAPQNGGDGCTGTRFRAKLLKSYVRITNTHLFLLEASPCEVQPWPLP